MIARIATPEGGAGEYGNTLLLFQPQSGAALDAESFGRLGLLVYAGPGGRDKFLRRTQGGVRLSQRAMSKLLQQLGNSTEAELAIEAIPRPRWWAFWRKRERLPRLSNDPPRFNLPPLDEVTLLAQLLRTAVRRAPLARKQEDDWDRRHDRDSSSSSSSSSSEYRGGGGTGGGGGASGAWSDAPATGRGPGVSAAGVIAGAAGLAAITAAATSNTRDGRATADGASDWGSGDASAASASSDSAGDTSATGTAY